MGYTFSSCLPLLSGYSLRTHPERQLAVQVREVRTREPVIARHRLA
jgi:hypothetical protein